MIQDGEENRIEGAQGDREGNLNGDVHVDSGDGHTVASQGSAKAQRLLEGRRKKQELAAKRKEQKREVLNRIKCISFSLLI